MIRTDLLASPADSARDSRELAGELAAARRKMVKASLRLRRVAEAAVNAGDDGAKTRAYRNALSRYRDACKRLNELNAEVPVPTRFYLFGVVPVGKVYGVPGWAKAKGLLPWWARWAVAARRVR